MFIPKNEMTILTIAGIVTTTLISALFGAIGVIVIMGAHALFGEPVPTELAKESAYVVGFIAFCMAWVTLCSDVTDMFVNDVYGE